MTKKIKPLVSVVMSIYNEPINWLHDSIESILNQTFRDFDFIIICDNPSYNDGIELLRKYAQEDSRIHIVFNQNNIGLTKSLNKGLAIARGDFIARMDADDISYPERLQLQYEYMSKHPETDVCGTNCKLFGDVNFLSQRYYILPEKNEEIAAYMLFKNPIAHPSVFMKRVIRGERVSYDESTIKAQDYRLWYDLYKRGATFYNIQECLLNYRISSTQISSTGRTSQFHVSNLIHAGLLNKMGVDSETEITMHNEICNFECSDISVDDKLDWMNRLYHKFESINSRTLQELYIFLSCQVCFRNKRPLKVLSIKHLKLSVFGKLYFYKGIMVSLLK